VLNRVKQKVACNMIGEQFKVLTKLSPFFLKHPAFLDPFYNSWAIIAGLL